MTTCTCQKDPTITCIKHPQGFFISHGILHPRQVKPAAQDPLEVADLMAQELQDLVDEAIEASGDPDALKSVQDPLQDYEHARGIQG